MLGVIIGGLMSGFFFYLMATLVNKLKVSYLKNKITRKISEGNIKIHDIIRIISYHTNVKKRQDEGLKYIGIAEEKFPTDREVNDVIFYYYANTGNFKKAINKAKSLIESTSNDADVFFTKGFCHYKLGEVDKAYECRDKAIEIDKSFSSKKYS